MGKCYDCYPIWMRHAMHYNMKYKYIVCAIFGAFLRAFLDIQIDLLFTFIIHIACLQLKLAVILYNDMCVRVRCARGALGARDAWLI